MTPILIKAIAHLSTLPTPQQDFIATIIFEELTFKEGYSGILTDGITPGQIEQAALAAMQEYNLRLRGATKV